MLHIKAVFYVSAAQMSPLSYIKDKDWCCITASVQKRSSKLQALFARSADRSSAGSWFCSLILTQHQMKNNITAHLI